jgi:Skp family chaperone for outer membrane proteins
MHKLRKTLTVAITFGCICATALPAVAQERTIKCIDWSKLNLSSQQQQQINSLESEWKTKYSQAQPKIVEAQKKLEALLPNPKSDPLEIMATQQTVARLKENLRNDATTNYLRKRALLNETQQHQLEGMLQQMVTDRQRANSAAQGEQSPGIQNIVNKIKWAIEPH